MCKKFFHPASADNLKRVWIAQKKADVEKNAQDDLRRQYDREQELYQNKALLSKESKERLELNFMYELPPGMKKIGETDKEDEEGKEPEYKFEWQRTWGNAPKEAYIQEGEGFKEQPFGIQVCQAKCIKCGKYGHMNTDKRCHLYGKSLDHDAPIQNVDQARLLNEMRQDGLAMRYSTWDLDKEAVESSGSGRVPIPKHALLEEERGVDRVEMLKNMSKEEKKKLLKKLKKHDKKEKKKSKKDKKKGRSKSESEDEWEERGATTTVKEEKKTAKSEDKKSPKIKKENGVKRERSLSREVTKKRSRSNEKRHRASDFFEERKRSISRDERRRSYSRGEDRSGRKGRKDRSISKEVKRERSDSTSPRKEKRKERSRSSRRDEEKGGRRRSSSRGKEENGGRRRSRERRERPVSREGRGRRS